VRRLTKPHEPCDVAHCNRRLLDQQLRGDVQAARVQILAEGRLAELGVRTRQLARRAGQCPCDPIKRQPSPVVTRDHDAGLQIQATALIDRGGAHTPISDPRASTGPQPA
jgi:hypothetical protein